MEHWKQQRRCGAMAISKNSRRIQFTLNNDKHMEKVIVDYLETCIDENSKIKEVLYNYIVSNSGIKSPQVTPIEVTKSDTKLLTVNKSDDSNKNIVSNSEEKLHEVSELEINELDELSKFI
jgi:hypothetical protein